MNELANIFYNRKAEKRYWFNENRKTYISFYYKGIKYEYKVENKDECLSIIRDIKLDEILET